MQIISILETLELLFVTKDFVQAGKIFNGSIHEGRRREGGIIEERGMYQIDRVKLDDDEGRGWGGTVEWYPTPCLPSPHFFHLSIRQYT